MLYAGPRDVKPRACSTGLPLGAQLCRPHAAGVAPVSFFPTPRTARDRHCHCRHQGAPPRPRAWVCGHREPEVTCNVLTARRPSPEHPPPDQQTTQWVLSEAPRPHLSRHWGTCCGSLTETCSAPGHSEPSRYPVTPLPAPASALHSGSTREAWCENEGEKEKRHLN